MELIKELSPYSIYKIEENQYIIKRDDLFFHNFVFHLVDPQDHDNMKYRLKGFPPNTRVTYSEIIWKDNQFYATILTSLKTVSDLIKVFRVAPDTWHAREVG